MTLLDAGPQGADAVESCPVPLVLGAAEPPRHAFGLLEQEVVTLGPYAGQPSVQERQDRHPRLDRVREPRDLGNVGVRTPTVEAVTMPRISL